jgi:hypothetical protein
MTISLARDTIVRKFTNYRNKMRRGGDDTATRELSEDLKRAADALVNLKSFSKGKSLFKRTLNTEILSKRDEILQDNPSLTRIGAFQKALKLLWASANQDYWEAQACGEIEEIYEYVLN